MQIIVNAENPEKTARAIVQAVTHFDDPAKLAEICTGLGTAMKGENDLNRPGLVSKCRFFSQFSRTYAYTCNRDVRERLLDCCSPCHDVFVAATPPLAPHALSIESVIIQSQASMSRNTWHRTAHRCTLCLVFLTCSEIYTRAESNRYR